MTDRATSFGTQAGSYDRGRPGYPQAAVDWMLPAGAERIADVGAGTGKLTDGLLAADRRQVIAIDPDADMLAVLAARHPGRVDVRVGTAEELPLEDGSVDAVVIGQAWHWVDPEAASTEIARVLRPGGCLGLIWNIRDESVDWVRKLSDVMHRSPGETVLDDGGPRVHAPFTALEHHEERWVRPLTIDGLVDLARSRSYVIAADPAERTEILNSVRAIGAAAAGPDGVLEMPYVTHAFRSTAPRV